MKCLSLHQPFASLVILGAKRFETRSWQTEYRGPLLIHASRRFPEEARALCREEPFRSALLRGRYRQSADLPLGALLGIVELEDCLPVTAVLHMLQNDPAERAFGDYRRARWAWRLARPRALPRPRPFTGRLGLFDVPWQTELPFPSA